MKMTMVVAALALCVSACAFDEAHEFESDDEDEVGQTSDAFTAIGSTVCEANGNPYARYSFGSTPCWLAVGTYAVASATSFQNPNRYVIGERLNVDDDFFFSVVNGTSVPTKQVSNFVSCSYGRCNVSHNGLASTTWPTSVQIGILRRDAVFVMGRPVGAVQEGGDTELRAIRIDSSGAVLGNHVIAQSYFVTGSQILVEGEYLGKDAASRDAGQPKPGTKEPVLIVSHFTSYPNWEIAAVMYRPGVPDVTSLSSVSACSVPGCAKGGSYPPKIQVAYSRVADKFLAASVFTNSNNDTFVRGQIYDGVTGALGPTIDFVEPWETTVHGLAVGVASDPDAQSNPDGSWTVFAGLRRYTVSPNGTYMAGYIDPPPESVAAFPTLHHTRATTDTHRYEWLNDQFLLGAISAERFDSNLGSSGQSYALDGGNIGCAEALAHGTNNVSLSLWSAYYYNAKKNMWEEGVCRRLIDH